MNIPKRKFFNTKLPTRNPAVERMIRPLNDFTSIEDWRDETFRSKISNKYHVSVDLSQFTDEEDDDVYILNYDENMKIRDFLDHVYFQIEPFEVKAFTYEYDWIIFNDSTKTELRVNEKQPKFKPFQDNRTLLSAKIFPFNKLIVNRI